MTIFQSVLLGIIQGLTEFLPISSSAHLVLVPFLLGWEFTDQAAFIFDVLVQLGTLVAVIVYFWYDLVVIVKSFLLGVFREKSPTGEQTRLGWYLIIATIPAIAAGLLFKETVEKAFSSPVVTAIFLILTALFLITAERLSKQNHQLKQLSWLDAILIGFFQALSLFPGISRSGSTITGGMLRNLDRQSAARFSFLMSIPVMLGAGGLAFIDLIQMPDFLNQMPPLLAGFLAALLVGYLSIRWLLRYLSRHSLSLFAIYCLLLSTITIIVAVVQGAV